MRVYMLSDRRSKKKLRVYMASEAKGLITVLGIYELLCWFIIQWHKGDKLTPHQMEYLSCCLTRLKKGNVQCETECVFTRCPTGGRSEGVK